MSFETVLYSVADGIARITLNRPDKHNALNHELMDDLDAAFEMASGDHSVSVIILSGAGKSFCAGYDTSGSYYITPPDADGWTRHSALSALTDIEQRYQRIWNCPKITIAQVHGNALAAGCYLALLCDIAVAADTARMGHPVSGAGASSMPLWQEMMPLKKARYMLLTSRVVDGPTAERFDMVTLSVPDSELPGTVEAIAVDCARFGPQAAQYKKTTYNTALDIQGLGASFRYHAQMNGLGRWSDDPTPYAKKPEP